MAKKKIMDTIKDIISSEIEEIKIESEVVEEIKEVKEVEIPKEVKKAPKKEKIKTEKTEKTSKTPKEEVKTDDELVQDYAKGKSYNLKNPQTYQAILKIIKG